MVDPMPLLIFCILVNAVRLIDRTASGALETRRPNSMGSKHKFFCPTWAVHLCRSGGIRHDRFVFLRWDSGVWSRTDITFPLVERHLHGVIIAMVPPFGGN